MNPAGIFSGRNGSGRRPTGLMTDRFRAVGISLTSTAVTSGGAASSSAQEVRASSLSAASYHLRLSEHKISGHGSAAGRYSASQGIPSHSESVGKWRRRDHLNVSGMQSGYPGKGFLVLRAGARVRKQRVCGAGAELGGDGQVGGLGKRSSSMNRGSPLDEDADR